MPTFEVDVEGKTYEVDAPDTNTAWAWAYTTHQQQFGAKPTAPTPSKERTTGEAFSDIGAQLKKGAAQLVQFPGQLYGLTTGDFSETGLYGYGKEMEAAAEAAKSPGLKAREAARAAAVAEAEKTGQLAAAKTAIGETITDPALALGLLAENLPGMLLPAGAAVGVGRAALQKGLAKGVEAAAAREAAIQAGKRAAIGAGAVQQGADVGTGAYEEVYKRLVSQGVSEPEAAAQTINLARAAGVSGTIISILAQRLPGASKLEEVLAGKTTTAGLGRAALASAAGEALGEVPEEVGGRFTQNLALRTVDPTQSLTAGLGEAGGMAALAGAGLGGIGGGISSARGKRALAEEEARKAQEAVEPQQAEAEAPKPVTGEAGIVRPEEETPISREVTKAAEPEVAPPAVISSSVPATKMPVAENYADMTVEALRSAKETADETNLQMDLSAIRKHFGEDAATAYAGMNRRQRNKWWDANATESFERDSSVFNGVNEETIDEYIQAYNKFDTESPQSLGRSIALIARKINDPDFIGSPEYLTLKNALSYAKEQGWSEKQVLDAMRGRASEWAGADAQELFKDLFKGVPKQAATTQTDSSLTKREELKALPPTVSPEPSIAEDRQRAEPVEPVVEAAAPEPVVTEAAAKPEEVPSAPEVVPQEEIATGKESTLWRYNEATGMWNPQRKVTQETQNQWLNVFQSDDPTASFLVSDKRPKGNPKIVPRVSAEKQPAGEVRPEGRVQPEGEGRAAVGDEEVKKSLRATPAQQVSDFEQTLRTALNKFGLKDVGVKLIDGMTEEGSYAQQLIQIAADSANPIRTLRHEAIHALRELGFFTPQQWKSLSKMAKDKWIDQYLKQRNVDGKPLKAGEESRYDAYMREYEGDMEKITEEAVADAFADFDATKPPAGLMQALLTRLRNLFQAIKSALTKVESPEQIFGKVERGELAAGRAETKSEAKSLRDRATANFLRWFGDSEVVDENGEPLVVYHGTNREFNVFSPTSKSINTTTFGDVETERTGIFLSDNPEFSKQYGSRVIPLYARVESPVKINRDLILDFADTIDPFGTDRDLHLLAKNSRKAWSMFDGEMGRRFVKFLQDRGYDGATFDESLETDSGDVEGKTFVVFDPSKIKLAKGNNGEYSLTDADIRKSLRKEEPKPTPTTAGQSALDTINQLGMGVKEPEKNLYQKAKDTFKQMGESPAGTKAEIKEAVRKFFANAESKVFSPDARWDSDIKNGLRKDMKPVEEIIGASLLVSQSQAVGPDAVATRAMLIGGAKYDAEVMKWVAYENKDANEIVKAKVLDDIAAKYGLTREEASQVAHTYLVAANYEGILKRNAKLEERIEKARSKAKELEDLIPILTMRYQNAIAELGEMDLEKDARRLEREFDQLNKKTKDDITKLNNEVDDLQAALVFVSEDQAAMVEPGKAIADSIPEVKKITEIWNEQRRMVKDAMVSGGLWTPEYADALMDNAAYVPFYREKQIEADEGPRVFMRGLQVKAKEQKLKGSKTAVNDVFENMALWQQYAINRAIRNHKMVQSIDVGKTIQAGDRKMAEQVSEPKRGMNVVRLWRDGKQEFYEVADPYYVEAFQSLGAVYIEPIKYFTAISNILRKTVVMYPLFSLGQLTQDSVAAIFSSGLKPRYAFKIPFLAVQEFIKTMKGWSTTHDELANYGAVGVRDFNANVAKEDAEITANIKAPKGTAGKIKYMLERIAMCADNAVRQATYIASQDAGLSKAEALEKAFEIINFRRRGSSKLLQLMGQTVPFFYAYLSAQRVAYKTLTLSGISPTERMAALETLAQTTAAVMALSFLYAMANGDDEEYKKTPATVRDRSLMIPGSGGVRIPLRPDFFLFPKVIAEHTYQLITDEGYSDGAKFRKSMADLFANATLSPNVVPQIVKPTFEAAINYSFFEGKPIIGYFEQNKEAGRQFNESTSEFAKWLGRFGASPQMVDHLVRGYFGSVGGLVLWGTNFFIEGEPGVPRPELTAHDMLTTMPGVGAFKQKPTENALKVDFYELRDAIAKAKNTYDDMKVRSPEGLEAFLQDEKNLARLAMDKQVTKIGDHLSKIRRAIQQVAAAPAERMSASEKQERIKELRDIEMELLKAVDVKAMRAQAKL